MVTYKPFQMWMPQKELAIHTASLPYDVYSREEAIQAVAGNTLSFLNIDRPETHFPISVDMYSDEVYQHAATTFNEQLEVGIFQQEPTAIFALYELTMDQHVQTGIVGLSSVHDYDENRIKKHELTRPEKEIDRIKHIESLNAHTGPIFLTCRTQKQLQQLIQDTKQRDADIEFTSTDGIKHRIFKITTDEELIKYQDALNLLPCTYIADGHHRAASAVKVAHRLRKSENKHLPVANSEAEYFLSVLFMADELTILPYHRVVKDLAGLNKDEFLHRIQQVVELSPSSNAVHPTTKYEFGMYLDNQWYALRLKPTDQSNDPVNSLAASALQEIILNPILNINDPRTDQRIEFIGGIRGTEELERRVQHDMAVAFSMPATTMDELLMVADHHLQMPPKSTWFEPKLRSGLFIHKL